MDVNLVLFKKNGSRKNFCLPDRGAVIGRRQDCDLCIPLMLVSRVHCELSHEPGGLKMRDLGSTNGTYVNGKKVEQAELKAGDYIQIGPITFGIQLEGQPDDIKVPDSVILPPPQKLTSPEQGQTGTFAGYHELNSSESHSATELLEDANDNTH